MAELVEDAEGVHQVFLTEEHPWLGVQLTAHDIFVDDVVTADLDLVDGRLRSFGDAHFEGHRVAHDVRLYGVYASEDVAIIIVEIADSVFVDGQTVLQALLVVDIPWAHRQQLREQLRRVLRVPHKADILDVVLLSFVDLEVDVDLTRAWDGNDAIAHQLGITVASSLVALDEVLQVFLVVGIDELLLLENLQQGGERTPTGEGEAFVGLAHRHTQLVVREGGVPFEVDIAHLRLAAAVDVERQVHEAWLANRFALLDGHRHLTEALLIVVLLDELACTVEGIGRNHCALLEAGALLEFLTVALGNTREGSLRQARTLGESNLQIGLVALVLSDQDTHIGEVPRLEEAVDG